MAISNLTIDCTNYEYNRITFDYSSGAGVTAEIEADYDGIGAFFKKTITLQPTSNLYDDETVNYLCGTETEYQIQIYNGSGVVIETQTVTCTNPCTPPSPPNDFDVDCNTRTSSGFDMTITEFDNSSSQANYTQLRIYRSTADPSTLTLPDPAYTLIATLTSDTTEYSDNTASANTQYWYEVEYYNSLSGAVSAAKITEGPCTTLASSCAEAYPLSEFDFDTSSSNCSNLVISDLFNDNTSFKIPTKYACYDISSISTIYASVWRVSQNSSQATTFQIGTFSTYYDPYTKDITLPLIEGVYYVKLTITYLDSFSRTKTITQTQCVFICGSLLCSIAQLIASDVTNSFLAEYYDAIDVLADCNKCKSAYEVYNYLKNYDADCNC